MNGLPRVASLECTASTHILIHRCQREYRRALLDPSDGLTSHHLQSAAQSLVATGAIWYCLAKTHGYPNLVRLCARQVNPVDFIGWHKSAFMVTTTRTRRRARRRAGAGRL